MEKSETRFTAKLMSGRLSSSLPTLKRVLYLLALTLLAEPALSQGEALQDFKAVYRVEKFASDIGLVTYQLKQEADQTHFSMRTKVSGLVALFRDDRVAEDSWLKQNDGRLQLQRYSYHQLGSKHNHNTELSLLWSEDGTTGTAKGSHDGKPVSIAVASDVRDALSFQLSLMQHVASNSGLDFAVLSKAELKHYAFKRVGKETLEIASKEIATTIVERQQDDRTTRLWLADKLQYTPVKIEQFKDGESDTRMLINSLTLSGIQVL
jgi:uncharacterized protein YjiS (DUF1127 family)